MSELVPTDDVPQDGEAFVAYVVALVEQGRRVAAVRSRPFALGPGGPQAPHTIPW